MTAAKRPTPAQRRVLAWLATRYDNSLPAMAERSSCSLGEPGDFVTAHVITTRALIRLGWIEPWQPYGRWHLTYAGRAALETANAIGAIGEEKS